MDLNTLALYINYKKFLLIIYSNILKYKNNKFKNGIFQNRIIENIVKFF